MPLITGLIRENVTLTVEEERTAQDATTKRNSPSWTSVATGVSAFFGSPGTARPGDLSSASVWKSATIISSSSYVGRSDVRFLVSAVSDPSLSGLVGSYWAVLHATGFPAGSLGIVPARYEAAVSRMAPPT